MIEKYINLNLSQRELDQWWLGELSGHLAGRLTFFGYTGLVGDDDRWTYIELDLT